VRRQEEQDNLTTIIGEWVRNIRLVRYLNGERAINREVSIVLRRFSFESAKAHIAILVSYGITYCWWTAPILTMLGYARYAQAPIEAATFFPAVWLLAVLSNQIQFLPHSLTHYGTAAAAMTRLERFLNLPDIQQHIIDRGKSLADNVGLPIRLHLSGVTLLYGESIALKSISLNIDLSAKTAIIGEVGAGKSSLLRLLSGEEAPTSGEITVEFSSGVRASIWAEEARERLRREIAYAPQEPFLSNTTLRENVDLFGTRSHDLVQEALEASALLTDVTQFEHGLDEEVGEIGINLSGGQRQRVSLARAFISSRPFLLLDDPLSAVDTRTEEQLFNSFCVGGRGFILVSHRLEHLDRCDRIIAIRGGVIVEDGTPEALRKLPQSEYRRLLDAQRGGSND
jgi:ABC-type multidrug transport system fused ATPase/permease subunit